MAAARPATTRSGPARAIAAAAGAAAALTLLRSLVFVLFEGADFDSDQAVFGLMAKHLAEGRAFPLFTYGQGYILGVSAWLAAPCVALLGATVTAMKLPLLAINVAVAALLVTRLARDAGLSSGAAFVAALPFVLPPVPIAAQLTEHAGGNVEPFLWVLLLWVARQRPFAFGLVAGVGFLNREFTAYGVVALLLVQALRGELRTREAMRFWVRAALVAAGVLLAIHVLQPYSTNAASRRPVVEWQGVEAARLRLAALFQSLLPFLFGLQPARLGLLVAPLAAFAFAVLGGRLARDAWRARPLPRHADFPVFLLLVGLQSLAGYVLVGIGLGAIAYVRYVLLAIFVPVAALALFQGLEPIVLLRRAAIAGVAAWALANAVDHVRLGREYATSPPPNPYRELADDLVAKGVRYGAADYWIAYHVTYLAQEAVRLDARGFSRDPEYRRLFRENLAEAVDVRPAGPSCPGRLVAAQFCVVGPPAPLRRVPKPGQPAEAPPSTTVPGATGGAAAPTSTPRENPAPAPEGAAR